MKSYRQKLPPLDPLIAFEASARNLSFTKAGHELHLTQAAISQQIRSLENDLPPKHQKLLINNYALVISAAEAGEGMGRRPS